MVYYFRGAAPSTLTAAHIAVCADCRAHTGRRPAQELLSQPDVGRVSMPAKVARVEPSLPPDPRGARGSEFHHNLRIPRGLRVLGGWPSLQWNRCCFRDKTCIKQHRPCGRVGRRPTFGPRAHLLRDGTPKSPVLRLFCPTRLVVRLNASRNNIKQYRCPRAQQNRFPFRAAPWYNPAEEQLKPFSVTVWAPSWTLSLEVNQRAWSSTPSRRCEAIGADVKSSLKQPDASAVAGQAEHRGASE
jgi:hypothetical protein